MSDNIPMRPRSKEKETVIKTLNQFIDVVRLTTENFWIKPVRYQDITMYSCYHWDGHKKYDVYSAILDTGVGGLRAGNGDTFDLAPNRMEELRSFLSEEKTLDSASMLLLYAKKACLEENHRLAIIEAVAG